MTTSLHFLRLSDRRLLSSRHSFDVVCLPFVEIVPADVQAPSLPRRAMLPYCAAKRHRLGAAAVQPLSTIDFYFGLVQSLAGICRPTRAFRAHPPNSTMKSPVGLAAPIRAHETCRVALGPPRDRPRNAPLLATRCTRQL